MRGVTTLSIPRVTLRPASYTLALALLLAVACPLRAQSACAESVSLDRWTRVSDEPFTSVVGARELSDGRLLVADGGQNAVLVIGPSGKAQRRITGTGDGPGELRLVSRLFPLRQDTSLVVDQGKRRWLVLAGDRVVATIAHAEPGTARLPYLEGIDDAGDVVDLRPHAFRRSPGVPFVRERTNAESLLVVMRPGILRGVRADGTRLARGADSVLSIARHGTAQTLVRRERPPPAALWLLENPLATEDQVMLFPDGWLAIVYAEPYRVDWRTPDRRWIRGAPLHISRVELTAPMRRALAREKWPVVEPPFAAREIPAWPEVLPAFVRDALLPLSDGRVAVQRTKDPADPVQVYDVVGRTGRCELRLRLPTGLRLTAHGAGAFYAVENDENLETWIVRHTWPVARVRGR